MCAVQPRQFAVDAIAAAHGASLSKGDRLIQPVFTPPDIVLGDVVLPLDETKRPAIDAARNSSFGHCSNCTATHASFGMEAQQPPAIRSPRCWIGRNRHAPGDSIHEYHRAHDHPIARCHVERHSNEKHVLLRQECIDIEQLLEDRDPARQEDVVNPGRGSVAQ